MTGPKFLSNGPASCPPKSSVGRAGCLRYRAQDIGASPYPNRGKTIVFRIRVVPRTISPLHGSGMVLFICRPQLTTKLHSPAMNGKSTQIRFGFSEPVSGVNPEVG